MRLDSLKARIAGADYVIDPHAVADALLRSPGRRPAFGRSADGMLVPGETTWLAAGPQEDAGRLGAHRPDPGEAGGA
jgi:hypothetical protein